MLLKELLAERGVHIEDKQLRRAFMNYGEKELLAHVLVKASKTVIVHAFVFKGDKVWYAVINGKRLSVKRTVNFINSVQTKGNVTMDKELLAQLLLEEL